MSVPTGDNRDPQPSTSSQLPETCRQFKFPEILLATRNFDESLLIGHGGFGKVYKGTIFNESNPVDAAIKRLDRSSNQGAAEFRTEVEILSRLQHCNLVSLFGYCNDEEEMILVFEYIPNRTLEDHLHKLGTPLSWHQRVTICIAAARGVDCLHAGMVIHRDIKSANMLLDDNWAAKISDFGLSRSMNMNLSSTHVSTLVKGTFGYLDPYYFNTGRLSRKSDVYAFGVVLFEVLCRKRAVDTRTTEDQWNLANWVQKSIKKGNLKHIVDLEMRDEISFKSLEAFARIAGRCLHQHPKKRPTMSEVIWNCFIALSIYICYIDHADSKLSTNSLGNNSSVSMRMDTNEVSEDLGIPSPSLKAFTFADLETVTSNFSLHMPFGRGGFGKVFLGWVEKNTFSPSKEGVGIAVAVKRRYADSSQGHVEWLRDVSLLERLVHGNIVNLLGYCSDEHKYFLVYEYFQNRSFDGFLYGNAPHIADPLSWKTRLSIMIGVARGLVYLHSSKDQVVCGIVKSSDILLDQVCNLNF
ncbi:serine/threonine/dual specificity protein kinase, catalytic domain-containing protein [Artemisia annua]|uniref:Serine/threonine/dual specificity protein kinase, catalytic domain-containing protein n=1 Tax=Artemisia annua TaxID=35608 RepID=A0A2U1PHH1_ARTAN|nr:serine/threonine/dual specificity protein kinase, catalytic domain-containing protein [Artemisia annua]